MVSLWPWKADISSPASYEKALSKLSTQITSANLSLETTRSRARRIKALWTLYTTLTYLLYTLIIALVLGPQKWDVLHYAGLAGAPVIIYTVRRGITMFFDWRIAQQKAYIEALQKQREAKIADLKRATRYDTTQELLQKYGGAGKPPAPTNPQQVQQGTKRKIATPAREQQRTGLPPPPTANIPGRTVGIAPSTPQRPNVDTSSPTSARARSFLSPSLQLGSPSNIAPEEPGFAPNAFSHPPTSQMRPAYEQPSKWYDRIFDVLLGEDETLAKNRFALICSNCRLVNGQAPPGVKSLEELGRWKCGGCGAWNGVENEATKAVKEIKQIQETDKIQSSDWVSSGNGDDESSQHMGGVSEAIQDALEEAEDMPKHVNEIPDSEDNSIEECSSELEDAREQDDESADLAAKRVTRSTSKKTAKGRM